MDDDPSGSRKKRIRHLGKIRPSKFVMFVIDSLLMGQVVECIYTVTGIVCKSKRDERLVHEYAQKIWEEPDAARWLSQRIVPLYERSERMDGSTSPQLTIHFDLEQSDEHYHKYAERPTSEESDHGGCLYLYSRSFEGAPPSRLAVTVAAAPGGTGETQEAT